MNNLNDLIEAKRNYYNLIDKLETIIDKIKKATDYIGDAQDNYLLSYTINDKIVDKKVLSSSKTKLINLENQISACIISLNRKLSTINDEINLLSENNIDI